ncbi:MAG: hypothetical protein R3F39_16480 [Myxococcota bacterium]
MAVLTAAVFAIGAVACDSGGDNNKADTTTNPDTTGDTTGDVPGDTTGPDADATGPDADATTPDADATADTETTPVDPCDPNPCKNPPATACNAAGDSTVTYKAEGTCTANGAAAACAYAEDVTTACAAEEKCVQGKCVGTGNPDEYTFDAAASYVTSLGIAPEGCCFDFDEDGKMDNGLQALLGLLAQFLDADVDTLLQESIDDGTITLLLENAGLTDAANQASGLALNGFFAEAETDLATNKAGNGTFLADPASFVEGTKTPLISLDAQIAAGKLTAGPALFQLSIPLGSLVEGSTASLDLTIENTRVKSDVSVGANGKGLTMANGQLGGVVPVAQFAVALNTLTADCACLGTSGADIIQVVSTDPKKLKLGCTPAFNAATPTCTDADGTICTALGDNKSLVCPALGILPFDQDSDADGQKDSISVGITLTGVSATISGLIAAEVAK